MALVVDASVGLKWVLREADSPRALALLASGEELLVPDFWLNEAANILWVQVHRKRWTADQARRALVLLKEAVVPTATVELDLQPMALEIGLAVGHSPYDCLYVAFAIAMGAENVVVADGPLHKAMRGNTDGKLAGLLLSLDDWADRT